MIKTYFFVPLTSRRFIEKSRTLSADYLVYDLEDAISGSSASIANENLKYINKAVPFYIRPEIKWQKIDFRYLDNLFDQGFNHFVIPKASSYDDIKQLVQWSGNKKTRTGLIILIENPMILVDLHEILRSFHDHIDGISLGSHDYCSFLKAKYDYDSYRFAHDLILNLAVSFSVEAIDITSMDIDNRERFITEVKRGFDKGYRSKFILHPKQLDYLDEIKYFPDEDIAYARLIAEKINLNDFDAVKINGQVLEKPHIQRIKEILKYIGYGTE